MKATRTTIHGDQSQHYLDWATNTIKHWLEFPNQYTLSEIRNALDTVDETMNPATPQTEDATVTRRNR